jgi:hypothetical protein
MAKRDRERFDHLFPSSKKHADLPDRHAKQLLFWFFLCFLLLYIKYKPYHSDFHRIHSTIEYLFTLYQFAINQTIGIVHEAGHGVCYLLHCPTFIGVLNGTLFQWLFPLGVAYYYKKRGNRMAYLAGLFIFGISLDYSAWYMSTAPESAIVPAAKSFLGVDGLHDFHYIFKTLGVLGYASVIAGATKALSVIVMLGSTIGMFLEAYSNANKTTRIS